MLRDLGNVSEGLGGDLTRDPLSKPPHFMGSPLIRLGIGTSAYSPAFLGNPPRESESHSVVSDSL